MPCHQKVRGDPVFHQSDLALCKKMMRVDEEGGRKITIFFILKVSLSSCNDGNMNPNTIKQ